MNERVLVTGCAGFLGFHLSKSLLDDRYDVIGLDNMSTGSKENVQFLSCYKNFKFIEGDIRDQFEVGAVSEIWNFACPASPPKYQQDPVGTFLTSTQGVYNLVKLAQRQHRCKLFQSSTSEVYGDPTVPVQTEAYWGNVNPVGPRSCYDEGKRAAETLLTDFHKQYGLPVKIVRIFNTYGPRMNPYDGRVITNFITQALEGKSLTVYGDGSQTRSFCYVSDAIRGYRALMDTADDCSSPVNIGNPNEFTILDIAYLIREKINPSLRIEFRPLPGDDPRQRKPDISKAKQLLGWEPSVQIQEGLDYMIDFYRSLHGA